MSNLTTRAGKGSPLTNNELDANFTNLNADKVEIGGDLSGTPTAPIVTKVQGQSFSSAAANVGEKLVWNGTAWAPATDPSGEPIGHADKSESSIGFNAGTRTFTISPVSASFVVWCKGVKHTYTSAQTVVIPNTTGLHFIYFNASGVLSTQMTYFTWEEHAPTAYIYWNATTQQAVYFGDERHGITLDWQTHEYLHRTRGAAIANGFGASGYTTTGTGATDADAQIDIGGGTFFDEDMQVDIVSTNTPVAGTWQQDLSGPALIPVLYLSGSSWVLDSPTNFPFKVVSGVPQYNLYSGGTWSTAPVSNNEYFVSWILATNNLTYPVIAIISQAPTNQLSGAEAMTFEGLNLNGFPSVEFRPLYKVIYQYKTGFTNSIKASTISVYDLRSLQSAGVAAALVQDHGNLSGLGDDDHAQYIHVSEVRTPSSAVKNSFLPSQTSNNGKYLTTDGINPSWGDVPSGSLTFTGDVTGTGNTGSSTTLTLANSGVTAGTFTKVTVDTKGRVTTGASANSSDIATALGFTPENVANKAVANGYASLDGSGKVPSNQLPSYVDDVLEYANLAAFPATGETGKIYIAIDTVKTYRWSGSAYVEITSSPGSTDAVPEGSTNLYFTNARARAAVGASGSLSYSTATGIFSYTQPTNVSAFTNDSGYLTGITGAQVTSALGYTPYNATNPAGYTTNVGTVYSVSGTGTVSGLTLTGSVTSSGSLQLGGTLSLTSGQVTTALGFTPYNATNPSGYTNNTGTVTSVSGTGTVSGLTLTGTVTGSGSLTLGGTLSLTSGQVTSALGYTPYNSSNPSAYITSSSNITGNAATATSSSQLNGYYSSSYSGPTSVVKQFFWDNLSANGGQARTFEIARLGIDYNDWNTGIGPFEVELYEAYYSRGLKKKYVIYWGYSNVYGMQLVEYSGNGDNNFQVRIGTPVQVSGDNYYLPVFVDVRYYSYVDVRVTTNRDITASNPPGIGSAYINAAPSATNISDFTADSTVNFASTTAVQINGNQLLHAGNYSSYALPLSGGTLTSQLLINRAFSTVDSGGSHLRLENTGTQTSIGFTYSGTAKGSIRVDSNGAMVLNSASGNYYFNYDLGSTSQTWHNGASAFLSLSGTTASFATLQQSGNQVLHAGNYSSYALPLSGGTVSGNLSVTGTINGVINTTAPGGSVLIKHSVSETDAWIFQENAANWGLYWKNAPSGNHTFGGYTSVGAELVGMSAANASGNGVTTSNFVGATSAIAQWMISNYTGYIWSASTVYAASSMIVGGNTVLHAANYGSYALPITGGSLTGNLTFDGASDKIITIRTASNWYYYLKGEGDNFRIYDAEGLNFLRAVYNGGGAGKYLQILGSTLQVNNNNTVTSSGALTVSGTIAGGGRVLAYSTTISMSGLDSNTYYPVTIPLPSNRTTRLRIQNALNSNVPSWSTHPGGFSCYIEWITNGSGWGTIGVHRRVNDWRESFTNVTIVGGLTQLGNSSQEVIWLRGGGNYFFSADCDVVPTIRTSYYEIYGQSVNTSAVVMNNPYDQAGGRMSYGTFHATSSMLVGSSTVLHAGNYGSYALPIGGGTMTGTIYSNASSIIIGQQGGSTRGYLYNDSAGFGFLTSGGSWAAYVPLGTNNWQVNGSITASGNVTAYSDERVKANWRQLDDGFVAKLASVKSGIYDRTDIDLTQAGVSAQSLRNVLPQTVIASSDGELSVAYGNAALVSAVELAKELVMLKRELAEIKSRLH